MIKLYGFPLPARSVYLEGLFGGTSPDAIKAVARDHLAAGFAVLDRHGRFAPHVAGDTFTLADIVFLYTADLANMVARKCLDRDFLAERPKMTELLRTLGENPNARQIAKAREAAIPAFVAAVRKRVGLDK